MEPRTFFLALLCISAAVFPLTNTLITRPKPLYQTLQLPPQWREIDTRVPTSQNLSNVDEAVSSTVGPLETRDGGIGGKKLVCYYNVPTMYDQPFPVYPEQIHPFLCTHLVLSFAHVQNSSIVPAHLEDLEFYRRTARLKAKNPELKVMLSVAGSSDENSSQPTDMETMMSSEESRTRFIRSTLAFLGEYDLDGLDMDWEFPGEGQKEQLSRFLAQFKEQSGVTRGGKEYLLSAAVPAAPKQIIDSGFDITAIAKSVDFVNLMTYDFHYYSWLTPLTGPVSPLFNTSYELGLLATLNAAWAVSYWEQGGMPSAKINLGIPTYGRTFRLVDINHHGYYALAMDVGQIGSGGYMSHVSICQFLDDPKTSFVYDMEAREPYAYRDRDWVSFENQGSAHEKAKFAVDRGLGGVMLYSLNADDAWKTCKTSAKPFPIVQTARDTLFPSD